MSGSDTSQGHESGRTITWLHLSDLHTCKPRTGWDAHRVLDPLIVDLKAMEQKHGLRPDLIFFTGDLAFGQIGPEQGNRIESQFDDGHAFLEGVRNAFNTPVPQQNVFLVPGNHDVNRDKVTNDQFEWLDGLSDSQPVTSLIQNADERWDGYMERLDAYRDFLKRHGYTHLLDDPKRLIFAVKRNIAGVEIGIAGLNSAWSCGRDAEKGKIWLAGDWQIGQLTSQLKDTAFRIVLMHHPHNWFSEYEDGPVRKAIERDFLFFVHGHEHDEWVTQLQNGLVRIHSAACYDRSNKENGYNFLRLAPDDASGEVWLRRYDSGGGGWVPRAVANNKTDDHGCWRLESLPGLPTNPSQRFSTEECAGDGAGARSPQNLGCPAVKAQKADARWPKRAYLALGLAILVGVAALLFFRPWKPTPREEISISFRQFFDEYRTAVEKSDPETGDLDSIVSFADLYEGRPFVWRCCIRQTRTDYREYLVTPSCEDPFDRDDLLGSVIVRFAGEFNSNIPDSQERWIAGEIGSTDRTGIVLENCRFVEFPVSRDK